jgi:homoserine dehydrogenase
MNYNKKYLSKRPFMLVFNTYRPAKGANTTVSGWADAQGGQWSVYESISFVDRVRDKDMIKAVAVIDIMEATVVKNGFPDIKADELMKHYLSKYRNETTEAVGAWIEQIAQERAKAGLPAPELPKLHEKPELPADVLESAVDAVIEKTGGKRREVQKAVKEAAQIVEHDIHVADANKQ